jgi:tetratricopeptide (TPR) repeat protein
VSIAEILTSQNRVEEARSYYEKMITLYPKTYLGYDKLSYSYYSQKQYSKAIEINMAAREMIPGDPHPCLNIARTYYAEANVDSAIYWVKKALEINPNNPEAQAFLKSIKE